MDTNYKEQLAWYESTVKPYAVTPIATKTRVWHASAAKSPQPFDLMGKSSKSFQENIDSKRVSNIQDSEELLIWKTMEADIINLSDEDNFSSLLEFETSFDKEEGLQKPNQKDDTSDYNQEPIVIDSVVELRIRSPVIRTMSEDTMYFDASNDWESEISFPMSIESDNNSKASSSIVTIIPQHQLIEERLGLFNQKAFIANQLESIYADIKNQDILLIMPSGPARDMCYLLPLTLQQPTNLITIVIVPSHGVLLEKNTNPFYNSQYIQTSFITRLRGSRRNWLSSLKLGQTILGAQQRNGMKPTVYLMTFDDFTKCKTDLQQLYKDKRIARLVLEDAHCFSQWGSDFHFGYLKLAEKLRRLFPDTPITALTAIPNERVHIDIMNNLQLQHTTTQVFKRSILL